MFLFIHIFDRTITRLHTHSRVCLPFFSFCCFFHSSGFFYLNCDSCWNSDMLRVIDSLGMIKIKQQTQCTDLFNDCIECISGAKILSFVLSSEQQLKCMLSVSVSQIYIVCSLIRITINIWYFFFYVIVFVIYGFRGWWRFGVKFQRFVHRAWSQYGLCQCIKKSLLPTKNKNHHPLCTHRMRESFYVFSLIHIHELNSVHVFVLYI